jgi:hypothetical protein
VRVQQNKTLFSIALIIVCIAAGTYLLKNFSLTFVQVEEDRAIVTVNFLFPMEQESITKSIEIETQLKGATDFSCAYKWISSRTVQIVIEEKSEIKGQKIRLWIQNIPTQNKGLLRNVVVPVQFKTPIELIEPKQDLLVSTEEAFSIQFNTPIQKSELIKAFECEADFRIEEGQDETTYVFTPKERLENNKEYVLAFKKGMRASSGEFLQQDKYVFIKTDSRPTITKLIPANESKWIGLFPKIVVTANVPIKEATLLLNKEEIEVYEIQDKKAVFYPSTRLKENESYEIEAFIKSKSGEKSDVIQSQFTTTDIPSDRVWLEVILKKDANILHVYQGNNLIKSFACSGAIEPVFGTFYVTQKQETYLDEQKKEGSNSWIKLSEGGVIQGLPRNSNWEIKQGVTRNIGKAQINGKIILNEEDAIWLYGKISLETMVIIRP